MFILWLTRPSPVVQENSVCLDRRPYFPRLMAVERKNATDETLRV